MSAPFDREVNVVNVGIASFSEAIRQTGAKATQLEWTPPAQGDRVTGTASEPRELPKLETVAPLGLSSVALRP